MRAVAVQAFSSVSNGALVCVSGPLMIALTGTFVATWRIEVSLDKGATWAPLARDLQGNPVSGTVAAVLSLNLPLPCCVRVACTARTSGTINAKIVADDGV